jgi:hypothetical protein
MLLMLKLGNRVFAQAPYPATAEKIKQLIVKKYPATGVGERKFYYNAVDLNDDGKNEYQVGLVGSDFCGTGGCTMLVLNPSMTQISRMILVEFPVFVGAPGGAEVTKKYSNLYVYTKGKGYVKLVWSGKAYPSNPSTAPAIKETEVEGKFKFLNEGSDVSYSF